MALSPLVLVKGAVLVVGGIVAVSAISGVSVNAVTMILERERKKTASQCLVCAGNRFHPCRLCGASGSIQWSPLADPVLPWPCQCPTCEGNKVQRCLNCVGRGYV